VSDTRSSLGKDHGSTSMLLRQREAEIAELERKQVEAQETISSLEHNLRLHQEQIVQWETKALLSTRRTRSQVSSSTVGWCFRTVRDTNNYFFGSHGLASMPKRYLLLSFCHHSH
jgi:hypothetical protein